MKYILALSLCAFLSGNAVCQTQKIAHRSHSGSNTSFKISNWTNLGLGYSEVEMRKMEIQRVSASVDSYKEVKKELEQEKKNVKNYRASALRDNYEAALTEKLDMLDQRIKLQEKMIELVKSEQKESITHDSTAHKLYDDIYKYRKAGDKEAMTKAEEEIQLAHKVNNEREQKHNKDRWIIEQEIETINTAYNKASVLSLKSKTALENEPVRVENEIEVPVLQEETAKAKKKRIRQEKKFEKQSDKKNRETEMPAVIDIQETKMRNVLRETSPVEVRASSQEKKSSFSIWTLLLFLGLPAIGGLIATLKKV